MSTLKRFWYSSFIYALWWQISRFVNRQFRCSRGDHDNRPVAGTEEVTNLCRNCGILMNPKAFGIWEIGLLDGTTREVTAINVHHAKNLVIYGERSPGQMAIVPQGAFKTHPQNIVTVRRLRDAGE